MTTQFGLSTVLVSIMVAASGCSGGFKDCSERRTCTGDDADAGTGGSSEGSGGALSEQAPDSGPEAGGAGGGPAGTGGMAAQTGGAPTFPDEPDAGTGGDTEDAGPDARPDAVVPPECQVDADCDDGLACNGAEVCTSGSCEPGEAVTCENTDPDHCRVECDEGSSGQCAVTALDGDGDGHASALCAAAPGDDCNDGVSAVHPGAADVCDGLDNDCDGKDDFAEGLKLSGTNKQLGPSKRGFAELAWSPEEGVYGAVWHGYPAEGTYYALLSPSGEVQGNELLIASNGASYPRIAAGDRAFGVVWFASGNLVFSQRRVTGQSITPQPLVLATGATSNSANITFLPNHGWYVGYVKDNGVYVRRVTPDGLALGTEKRLGSTTVPYVFVDAVGDKVATTWTESDGEARFRLMDADMTLGPVTRLESTTTPFPSGTRDHLVAITAIDGEYAITWGRPRTDGNTTVYDLMLQVRDRNGALRCSASGVESSGIPQGVAAFGGGYVVQTIDLSKITLHRFSHDCEPQVAPSTVAQVAGAYVGWGSIARSDSGLLSVWSEIAADARVMFRHLGPNLCD